MVCREGLENVVAKALRVRLDSMLLVCLCYYFPSTYLVYSFSCNGRPLIVYSVCDMINLSLKIFKLLCLIGFLKCVSGINEVSDVFRCWLRVLVVYVFGKFPQSPMVFVS